jgi:hypothetical protein
LIVLATPAELPAGRVIRALDLQTLLKASIGTKDTSFTTYKPAIVPFWRNITAAAGVVAGVFISIGTRGANAAATIANITIGNITAAAITGLMMMEMVP